MNFFSASSKLRCLLVQKNAFVQNAENRKGSISLILKVCPVVEDLRVKQVPMEHKVKSEVKEVRV
jgi:hypothetical protein